MIRLTRFDGSEMVVNADLIEFIEASPDTVISMTSGRKVLVKETPEAVIALVVGYRQRILGRQQPAEKG